MLFETKKYKGYSIIYIYTEIIPEITKVFEQNLIKIEDNVIIDFSECSYLCSTGLGIIAKYSKQIKNLRKKIALYGLNRHILRLFEITRLSKIIKIFDDIQEAKEYITS